MEAGLFFEIKTLKVKDGKELTAAKPDADGFYTQPLMIFGKPSRNNVKYEDMSTLNAINNPQGRFYKLLTEGCLEGEWGHPLANVDPRAHIQRIMDIHKPNVSHYFNKIYSKETEKGSVVVFGKVKPFGEKGKYLEESLQDPNHNTAWSLRSLCTKPKVIQGVQHKKMLMLVTFDSVGGPGFEEASKRYASNESMEIPVATKDLMGMDNFSDMVGTESFNDEQLYDMLGSDKITLNHDIVAWPDLQKKQLLTNDRKLSIFHTLHQGR